MTFKSDFSEVEVREGGGREADVSPAVKDLKFSSVDSLFF